MPNEKMFALFEKELIKQQVSESTRDNYLRQIKYLSDYFPDKKIEKLNRDQLAEFMVFLDSRKRLSATTQNLAICALVFFYNKMLGKNIDIRSIPIKRRKIVTIPVVFDPEEILKIMECIKNQKHRLMLLLAYSSGLSIYQTTHIKMQDIDYRRKRIKVIPYNQPGKIIYTVLSDAVSKELKTYLEKEKPEKYVFEGVVRGKPYAGERMVQYVFLKAMEKAQITKKASPKDLKHSFIVHLRDRGYSVKSILEMLGHTNPLSFYRYTLANEKNVRDIVSPYDLILAEKYSEKIDTKILNNLVKKIANDEEKNYFQEAILCLSLGALRAGVIMAWTAVIRNIQARCLQFGNRLDPAIQKHYKDARTISTIDDFAFINDKTVLLASTDLGIFDKHQKSTLIECLDLRNRCGHPGNYSPGPQKVLSYIEDIIHVVYS
jgi:site-specific recombinase XerD